MFALHQDDSDFTLAVCIGAPGGWRGADLVYVEPGGGGRPGTPDEADASARAVRHTHVAGVGVLHAAEAYHRVTPVADGVRHSLVVQAMRDDAEWKRGFLSGEG